MFKHCNISAPKKANIFQDPKGDQERRKCMPQVESIRKLVDIYHK